MISDRPVQTHMTTIFTEPLIILMALVFLFISLLNHQTQLTILILLVLGMIVFTKFWSRFSFSKMTFDSEIDKNKVFPGERIRFNIEAGNNKFLPVQVQVKVMIDESHFISDTPACENSFLLWFQKTTFSWSLKAMHRGCFNIGHPHIIAADLFNFSQDIKSGRIVLMLLYIRKLFPSDRFQCLSIIFSVFQVRKALCRTLCISLAHGNTRVLHPSNSSTGKPVQGMTNSRKKCANRLSRKKY